MKTSESITKITPAFLKAQKEIDVVVKDSTNPYFRSKYADLAGVIDACKDKLHKAGIAVLQPINENNVETVLLHESGEWFSSSTPIVVKSANDPQALGSAISYARRYGLQSMVLLRAVDDDANEASGKNGVKPSEAKKADPTDEWEQDMTSTVRTVTQPTEEKVEENICPEHNVKMNKFTKGTRTWYSHTLEGKWCSGKGYK